MSDQLMFNRDTPRKAITVKIKDADKGEVEAAFSTFEVKDHDADWTLPGAFDDGGPVRLSMYGHRSWDGEPAIGKGVIRVEGDHAIFDGGFNLAMHSAREVFESIKFMGDLQEWSYGYDVIETGELTEELRQKGVARVLKKIKVHEVSPVLLGAGIDTHTVVVKQKDDAEPEIKELAIKEFARFVRTRNRLRQA